MRQPSFSSLISVGGYLRSLEKVARPPFCFKEDAQYYFSVLTLFFYTTVCPLVTAWNFRHTFKKIYIIIIIIVVVVVVIVLVVVVVD